MRVKARESDVQKAIMELLAAERVLAIRLNTAAFRVGKRVIHTHSGGAGVADILAFPQRRNCELPEIWWIECKSPDGRQTPEQVNFEGLVTGHGHRYIVARSADDVLKELRG